MSYPGSHNKGPIVSEQGFSVGTKLSNTPIIDADGVLAAASMSPAFMKLASGALTAGNANAFAFAWQNPEASKIIVHRVIIDITTAGGTGSSVLDVGIVANATATADTLIDGVDLNTIAVRDNISDVGTNGKSRGKVDEKGGTNDYITGKILVANAASLVGKYYIFYTTV